MKLSRKKLVLVILGIIMCLLLSGCSRSERDVASSNVKGIVESIRSGE